MVNLIKLLEWFFQWKCGWLHRFLGHIQMARLTVRLEEKVQKNDTVFISWHNCKLWIVIGKCQSMSQQLDNARDICKHLHNNDHPLLTLYIQESSDDAWIYTQFWIIWKLTHLSNISNFCNGRIYTIFRNANKIDNQKSIITNYSLPIIPGSLFPWMMRHQH